MSNFTKALKDHIQQNRGKYSAGAGIAGTLGAANLAANGYLGSDNQLLVQDNLGKVARNLNASAQRDYAKGNVDTGLSVYSRPDTLFTKEDGSIDKLLLADRLLQKENIPFLGKKVGQTLAEKIGNLDSDQEQLNFTFRNPMYSLNNFKDYNTNIIKGTYDSIKEDLV